MVNCPKCGAAVREEKAFCHNCGSPMDAAMRQREEPQPDFGATVIEPPRRTAPQPFVPPAITEVQPTGRETAPVAPQQQHHPATARVALPLPPDAQTPGRRKSSRKIGVGFVILLLFLMFAVFVLALVLD